MIYTVKEVADILKLPISTVYDYIHNNTIPSFKIGKHIRVRKEDLDMTIKILMM